MSYANMDGVPTQTAGTSELLASDWNTYVRDNFDSIKFGHIVCTSSTRPSGIDEGTMIYETDTNKVLVYSGSSWVEISDLDRTGGLAETSPGHLIVADNTAKSALSASEGMMVYQSDNDKFFVYSGSAWIEVANLSVTSGVSAVSNCLVPPYCRLTRSNVTQSFPNGAFTAMTFDSEAVDTDGMHSTSSNTERITINTPGVYTFSFHSGDISSSRNQIAADFYKNGNKIARLADNVTSANTCSFSVVYEAALSDYFEVRVQPYTDNAGNVTFNNTSFFSAVWNGRTS